TLDVPKSGHALEQRINPAINRHCGRSHVIRVRRTGLVIIVLQEVAPSCATQLGIVVCPINLAPEIPSHQTSYYCIGTKVLPARDACRGYGRCEPISDRFRE